MRNYLLRLLCFSLVLGTIPTVLIGLVSYSIATRDIEAKVNEGNMQLLLQTQMRVEQMLQTLEMSAMQLANSSAVQSVMNSGLTSGDFARVRELTTELAHLRGPAIVKQAYLVNFGHNWAISLESLKQLSELEQLPEFTAYAAEPANMFWRTDKDGGQAAGQQPNDKDLQNKPADTVSLVMKLPMQMKTSEPKGLLIVQISAAELREGLAPASRLGSSFVIGPAGACVFIGSAGSGVICRDQQTDFFPGAGRRQEAGNASL
ncbi:hypothetical protein ACHHV8_04190 [Paenibacillus sp. TAB 01]|uniref:hypothetical protein n=1 Tax=Paenibacillus sp. TAB 01 TaxID=3368988 RepID=UPI0037536A16